MPTNQGSLVRTGLMIAMTAALSATITSCSMAEPEWHDSKAPSSPAGEAYVAGFKISLPPGYTRTQHISDYPYYMLDDLDHSEPYFFRDASQPEQVEGQVPAYDGAKDLLFARTSTYPRSLTVMVKRAYGDNSASTLLELLNKQTRTNKPVGPEITFSAPEVGTINGVRFARGTWQGSDTVSRIYVQANAHTRVRVHGMYAVTSLDGKDVIIMATAPEADSLKPLEQAIYSFHK